MQMTISIVVMQVTVSVVDIYVTVSGKNNNKGIDNVPGSPAIFQRGNYRFDPEKSVLMILYSDTVKFKCCSSNRWKNAAG